jgi:hypothetical protein
MKLTGAAILVSRGMKALQAAPAAYPYRSAASDSACSTAGSVITVSDREFLVAIPDAWLGRWETTYYQGPDGVDSGSPVPWEFSATAIRTPRGDFAIRSTKEQLEDGQSVLELSLSGCSARLNIASHGQPPGWWLTWLDNGEALGRYFLSRHLPRVGSVHQIRGQPG